MGGACVSCGAEVAEGARFCEVCGAPQWTVCSACGSEQRASAAFCSACGTALRSEARRAAGTTEHEERRVVTVLFADLAGSTAFGESVDPEDVRALQAELYDLVGGEVERHGGITEKFVGDAILAVFGAPRAHEDDAERAVRAALAIRDGFPDFAARIGDRHDVDVGIRIGVHTGEVIAGREAASRGELMVSGDAVNVAARLQQLAVPGSVLVGERTRLATQRSIAYGEARALEARGKRAPVQAWEALHALSAAPVRRRVYAAPLVGRNEELGVLRLAATRVERERVPQLVTVFGHAGVGKSRLLEEFADGLADAHVVTGRCVPYGDGITYLPLVEVASQLVGILDDDPADVALAKLRSAVETAVSPNHVAKVAAALAWTLGVDLPEGSSGIAVSEDVRRTLHEGWAAYLASLGRERLLVLVVEDIHWASEPLLDLVDDLADRLDGTAVLILCASRPEVLDSRPSWGTGRLTSSSLTVAPLDPVHAAVLLRELLESDAVHEHVARAILEPAEGNPFFVEEMLSMLVELGALERRNGGWVAKPDLADAALPDSIHGVIAARIDLLQAAERDALRRCSVMGRVFWPSAVGVDDELIASLARRALASEQDESSISGRRAFAFKHALTHEVAYATLPRTERRELHTRVAEWIADVMPDRQAETTELIAYHYEQALAYGERDAELARRTFEAVLASARAAVRRGAYASAAGLLSRALNLAPSEDARGRAMLLAAQVDVHQGSYDRAVERLDDALATAEHLGDAALRADALGWKTRACWLSGRWRDAVESSQTAVATLEGLPESAELARALARLSQIEMLRALPAAEATALRAIEVAGRTGERAAEANARTNLFTSLANSVPPSPKEVAAIIQLAVGAGAHDEAARAVVNYLWSAWLTSPLELVESAVLEMTRDLDIGLSTEFYDQYLHMSLAALVYVPAGRWAEADSAAAHSFEIDSSVANRLVWLWVVTGLALRRGDLSEVDRLLPEFREAALASEEPQRILPMLSIAIPRALLAGDSREVRALADVAGGLHAMAVSSSSALAIFRALAAEGEGERLERVMGTLGDTAEGVPRAVGSVARGLLELLDGRADEAARALLSAESEFRALGRHYDAACVALEVARALEAQGDAGRSGAARARAAGVLEPLACVNAY